MSRYTVPSFINPDAPDPSFDDVFGEDMFRCDSCGDDKPLDALVWSPDPAAKICCDCRYDERRECADQSSCPKGTRDCCRGIFAYHTCWKCNDGERPCVNGSPNRCDYPRARNE